MKILWFNWRDITNPEAGGAEVLTHEIASRLANGRSNQVTLFTSRYPNAIAVESLDGVEIIRQGGRFSVYRKAKHYYHKYKNKYDLVIDEINVRPFLTPKFVKDEHPILALIHQISPEQFMIELPFPFSYIGRYFLENRWLSHYRDTLTVTVSVSTQRDLERLGFNKVRVIPQGLSARPLDRLASKESSPTFVFIGRLKRHKLPDHAIRAFSLVKRKIPDAKLWIIGDGYMRTELENKCETKDVTFFGHVRPELKYDLLSKAHIALVPAIREGWGLVVTESNSMGTPVVAYDVPGLRDSVKHDETGILVDHPSPERLASSAIKLIEDRMLLHKYSLNALVYSRQFSWDKSARAFENSIKEVMNDKPQL